MYGLMYVSVEYMHMYECNSLIPLIYVCKRRPPEHLASAQRSMGACMQMNTRLTCGCTESQIMPVQTGTLAHGTRLRTFQHKKADGLVSRPCVQHTRTQIKYQYTLRGIYSCTVACAYLVLVQDKRLREKFVGYLVFAACVGSL
jgi:hypothetical protein